MEDVELSAGGRVLVVSLLEVVPEVWLTSNCLSPQEPKQEGALRLYSSKQVETGLA
jgi:hypothetical protein